MPGYLIQTSLPFVPAEPANTIPVHAWGVYGAVCEYAEKCDLGMDEDVDLYVWPADTTDPTDYCAYHAFRHMDGHIVVIQTKHDMTLEKCRSLVGRAVRHNQYDFVGTIEHVTDTQVCVKRTHHQPAQDHHTADGYFHVEAKTYYTHTFLPPHELSLL